MTVQMAIVRALFIQRLVRSCISDLGNQRKWEMHFILKPLKLLNGTRTFSLGSRKGNNNEGEEDKSDQSYPDPRRQELPFRRIRPLSPLERLSRMLPQDSLSPDVVKLREHKQCAPDNDVNVQGNPSPSGTLPRHFCREHTESAQPEVQMADDPTHIENISDDQCILNTSVKPNESASCVCETSPSIYEHVPSTLPGERLLTLGELLIAEYRKKGRVEYRKMFLLQKGIRLQSNWGTIGHDDLVGQPSGKFWKTTIGIPILIRRCSLEDYVLYMKRGPAIAYPKDASTMLMMMDVTEGDCVLESGSGSGAMSLLLSRAVGSKGTVVSVEVRDDHHNIAVKNYKRWCASWSLRRGEEWPNNVQFHHADLQSASTLLDGWGFHSVALDLVSPHLVLPTVIPRLHPGAVCAVYLANITQTIDLLEGLRCLALPVLCERIIEVPIRDWLVAPALQKNGMFCKRKPPISDGEPRDDDTEKELTVKQPRPFASVPYIARPHPEQMCHTAFLVKLRKCT